MFAYMWSTMKRRPALAIKMSIMLIFFIVLFIIVEYYTPSENRWMEFLALIGGALIGVGLDAFIIYFERSHYICIDN